MQLNLTRYWFEFKKNDDLFPQAYTRCGVTAYNYNDAINLLNQYMFKGNIMPIIKNVIENIDVSTLDANHILPNLVIPPNFRGIWYPGGYHILNH
ncbi:hypothetical protein [Mucilaginibacter sp. OK098]|uniref:hypothetical protein n=1 Tax=Mucilaginibacter sp. OK098 TaxID=1855297 RepID=UPI000915619B|nr:hypothetical protein [Mucilaginibacter sp. OK098]SHN09662.1 hypothetical protein SAMN05216524_105172 [Mucilaginibacter sp. OK098]